MARTAKKVAELVTIKATTGVRVAGVGLAAGKTMDVDRETAAAVVVTGRAVYVDKPARKAPVKKSATGSGGPDEGAEEGTEEGAEEGDEFGNGPDA